MSTKSEQETNVQAQELELAARLGLTPEQLAAARSMAPAEVEELRRRERVKDLARERIRAALESWRGGSGELDPELAAKREARRGELAGMTKAQLVEALVAAELPAKGGRRGDGVGYAAVHGVYAWEDLRELGHETVAALLREAIPGRRTTAGSAACYPTTHPDVVEGRVQVHGRAKRTF